MITKYITTYAIERDHARDFGFFIVDVPEVKQRGIGFQIAIGKKVFGISIHTAQQVKTYETY